MPIGSGIVYNTGDLILSQVSSSGTAFLETKIAAATSSIIYFDSNGAINSASLNSITVGTSSYVSGSRSIITNLTASNISASGTISASLFVGSHTGSTFGTSSWAINALTASYISPSGNSFVQGGNSFGTTALLGTNDAQPLALETNGTTRMSINSNGNVAINTSTSGLYRLNIADTHRGSAASASLNIETTQNQNQGLATTSNDSGINNVYYVNNFTSSTAIQNQAIYNQLYINGSGSFSGSYRASRNAINISNTASMDINGNIINTWLTNQISSNIPNFNIPNWIAGTQTYVDLIPNYNSTGSITNLYQHQIGSPFPSGGAGGITVNNSYGIYIAKQKTTNIVTNGWGIYQVDTGDLNIFAGKTRIGSTTVPVNALDVTGNISASVVTASLFFGTSSWASNALTASFLPVGTYNITSSWSTNALTASSVTSTSNAFIRGGNSFGANAMLGLNDNFRLDIETNGTAIISLTGSNVGIGTTVPAYLLDVSGSSRHGYRTADTHQFTGSVSVSGSLNATASWANNVVSASYATTAQTANALNTGNSYTITNLTASGVVRAAQIAEKVVTFTPLTGSITGAPAWYRIISGSGVLDSGRVRMSANYDNSRSDIEFTYAVRNYDTDGAGAFINITRASTYNSLFNAVRVIETGNLAEPYAIDVLIGNYLNNTTPGTVTCLYESQFIGAVLDTPTFVSASATGSNIVKTVYTTYTSGYPRIGPTYSDGLAVANYQGQLTVGYRGNYAYNTPSTLNYALLVSGSVGIGTSSPTQKLDVIGGTISTDSELYSLGGRLSLYRSAGDSFIDWSSGRSLGFRTETTVGGGSASEKMRIDSTGNVGIGTTNPTTKLHVSGSITALDGTFVSNVTSGTDRYFLNCYGTSTNQIFALYENSNTAYLNSYSSMAFRANQNGGSGGYFVFTGANVGIGTTIPSGKLHVVGTANVIELSQATAGAATYYVMDNTVETGGRRYRFGYSGASSDKGSFTIYNATDNITPFTILTGGNVGIGTIVPAYLLDVSGSSRHGYRLSDNHYFTGSVNISGSVTAISFTGSLSGSITSALTASYLTPANSYTITNLTASNISASLTGSFGIVGIGTNSPNNKLDIFGATGTTLNMSNVDDGSRGGKLTFISSSATGRQFYVGTNSSIYNLVFGIDSIERARIDTNGNLGIGITSPTVRLHVSGSSIITNPNPSANSAVLLVQDEGTATTVKDGTTLRVVNNGSAANFSVFEASSAVSDFVILNNGNVGIGTTTPGALLELSSSTAASLLNVKGAGGNGLLFVSGSGNVGIGTTSPAYKLDVVNAAGVTIRIQNTANTSDAYLITQNTLGSTFFGINATGGYIYNQGSLPILFYTNATERMRLDSTGGINIGTSSQLNSSRVSIADSALKTSAGNCLTFATATGGSNDFQLIISRGSSTSGYYAFQAVEQGIGYKNIVFNQDGGNVGIGTTNATDKLTLYGALASYKTGADTIQTQVYLANTGNTRAFNLQLNSGGTGLDLWSYNSANAWLRHTTFDYNGSVGIGTATSILGKLQLDSGVAPYYGPATGSATPNGMFTLGSVTGDVVNTFGVDASATAYAWIQPRKVTGATYYSLALNPNGGNVGIGTVTPAAKLEITGSSNSALLNIKSPISGAILYVSGSGAVGIGTSNVGAFTLQVSGSFGATTKSFIIDHPTKAGKKLMYGSLESPYHGIRLTGRDTLVNGKCKVELPDYIYKLILHDSVNIQLTGIKCNKTLYVDDINIPENYFTIAYDKAIFESYKDYDFFWDFTAIRADVPELTTEL